MPSSDLSTKKNWARNIIEENIATVERILDTESVTFFCSSEKHTIKHVYIVFFP